MTNRQLTDAPPGQPQFDQPEEPAHAEADVVPDPAHPSDSSPHGGQLHLPWWMWIVPILWAGAFLTGSSALGRLSADTVSFLRFAVTVLGGAIFLRRPTLALVAARPSRQAWGALVLLALVGGVAYHVLFYLGLARSEPPIASVVIATNPMLTALGAAIFLRDRRPTAALFVGLVLAFSGAVLLAGDHAGRADTDLPFLARIARGWGTGETLCLAASFAWAIYAVLLQRFRSGILRPYPSAGVTFVVYTMTAVVLLPVVLLSGGAEEIPTMNTREWGCMIYLGLISTVLAYTMYNAAIDRVGSARVSQVTYAVPTLTTLLSILFRGFHPTAITWCGLAIVTVGLIVSDGRAIRALRAKFAGPLAVRGK